MPTKFHIEKANLDFEAGFDRPDFALFRDTAGLLDHLFRRLEPHGLRLNDLRVERGANAVGDFHVLCYLFNFWMTIRVRVDRVEVACAELPNQLVDRVRAAILDVLTAVKNHRADLSFRAFAMALGMHVKLEGKSRKDYLSRFAPNAPVGFGPLTASGAVFYFGQDGDRLLSTVTADASAVIPEAVYLRLQAVWDAKKVAIDALPALTDGFVRQAMDRLDLQLWQ